MTRYFLIVFREITKTPPPHPVSPFSITVSALRRWPEYAETGYSQIKSDQSNLGGQIRGAGSVG